MGIGYCPFKCSFCASSVSKNRTRRIRPAKKIFEEMKTLHEKYSFSFFVFFDPLLFIFCLEELEIY